MNGTSSHHDIDSDPPESAEEPISATVARHEVDIAKLQAADVGILADVKELKASAATIKGAVAEGVSGFMNTATFKIGERIVLLILVAIAAKYGLKLEIPQ